MYNRNDPRFRRRLNQISQNLESANETAQEGLFSFSENYIKPCLNSITTFIEPCTKECFPDPRDRSRRNPRSRGRGAHLERSFDFYDDWEADETDALLALEDDEFDRVVGGYGTQESPPTLPQQQQQQPAQRRSHMSYGQRAGLPPGKSAVLPYDVGSDPTVIPNQSYFGFLTRLPFNIGRGRLRYRPSAADLQDRTKKKGKTSTGEEVDTLAEEGEEEDDNEDLAEQSHNPALRSTRSRHRSDTTNSGHTTDSLSSRGDIFPSDDEADAIPLDDEFTVALERRTTNSNSNSGSVRRTSGTDDASSASAKKRKNKPLAPTDVSSDVEGTNRPLSSRSNRGRYRFGGKSSGSTPRSTRSASSDPEMGEIPNLSALKTEEKQAEEDEAALVQKNRTEAHRLAVERGLASELDNDETFADSDRAEAAQGAADGSATGHDPVSISIAEGPIQMEDNEAGSVDEGVAGHQSNG